MRTFNVDVLKRDTLVLLPNNANDHVKLEKGHLNKTELQRHVATLTSEKNRTFKLSRIPELRGWGVNCNISNLENADSVPRLKIRYDTIR